jgi:hypothetical protein
MRSLLSSLFVLALLPVCQAQPTTATDWAWTPIIKHEGLDISFIFYSRADSRNNGVVIKLANENEYAIDYRFKVIFRSDDDVRVEEVEGTLNAGEARTGDASGLFWVPFPDGRSISEVGLRGYRVTPAG